MEDYEKSSGNVFADLGFPDSEQEIAKAKLTVQIYRLLKNRDSTQAEAAKLLGTTQARVSAIIRCHPISVSVGRLMGFLTTLGQCKNEEGSLSFISPACRMSFAVSSIAFANRLGFLFSFVIDSLL
jgi:predicted XRE-type DNA-binding protein